MIKANKKHFRKRKGTKIIFRERKRIRGFKSFLEDKVKEIENISVKESRKIGNHFLGRENERESRINKI